jgi:putative transposase
MKTYTLRIFPTKEQSVQLNELSSIRMDVWNTLINIQHKSYKETNTIYNKFNLINLLPELKHTLKNDWKKLNSKALQTVASEVSNSYTSFFRKVKKDKSAKPPSLIEITSFHTLVFNQSGWSFKEDTLVINQIPFVYRTHLKDIHTFNVKELRIKNKNNKWLVDLIVDDTPKFEKTKTIQTKVLSIDLGLSKLGTCIDNEGNVIIIPNKAKKINKYFEKQINNVKSNQSKTKKYSNRWKRLQKVKKSLYNKKNNQIKNTLHIQSKKLVNMNYNTIIVGDLTVKQLMATETNKYSKVSKSFGNSNISMFLEFLAYKCQSNQINLMKVDERNTTQTDCLTGKKFKDKVNLHQRTVTLHNGFVIDRDINSAINILKRYYNNQLASMNEPFVVNTDVLVNSLQNYQRNPFL